MSKVKPKFAIQLPVMSWEEPIEIEILKFVRSMKRQWKSQVHGNIWFSVNKAAENYVNAYETVEKHILEEIEFRKKYGQPT